MNNMYYFVVLRYIWLNMNNLSCILRTIDWLIQPPYIDFKRGIKKY